MRRAARLGLFIGLIACLALPGQARALATSDSLTAWREASAMERLRLAARFGKSFQSLSESFTSGYFVTCIDEIAGYGKAASAHRGRLARMPSGPDAAQGRRRVGPGTIAPDHRLLPSAAVSS